MSRAIAFGSFGTAVAAAAITAVPDRPEDARAIVRDLSASEVAAAALQP